MTDGYVQFLAGKIPTAKAVGVDSVEGVHPRLFDFQRHCVEFAMRQGRTGCFLDTGLGKTVVQLEFCRLSLRHAGRFALILTPLAVAWQIQAEAERFGIESRVVRARADVRPGINICNYDRLEKLDLGIFDIVSLDESSILKNFTGKTTRSLIDGFAHARFRMAATATPAPNDHMELGQHVEFLGLMPSNEMLMRWFITDQTQMGRYRLKSHAEVPFWDWMAGWARMAATPADLGFDGSAFSLPPLEVVRHRTTNGESVVVPGTLFASAPSATTLHDIKRQTTAARADLAAELAEGGCPVVVWCDTNYEADALATRIKDAVDVRGALPIAEKERRLRAFSEGEARAIITKPSLAGFGLNWQHCARMVFVGRNFSYENYYQAVRRCWRFGQRRPVRVDLIVAEGEDEIGRVIDRKATDHQRMKREMAAAMRRSRCGSAEVRVAYDPRHEAEVPKWLCAV